MSPPLGVADIRESIKDPERYAAALRSYKWGTSDCGAIRRVIEALLSPATLEAGGQSTAYLVSRLRGIALKPCKSMSGHLIYACYPCGPDGKVVIPRRKRRQKPEWLTAPQVLALLDTGLLPSGHAEGLWKRELEQRAFNQTNKPKPFPNAPLPRIADPRSFSYDWALVMQEDTETEEERGFWRWLCQDARQRAVQKRTADGLYQVAEYFRLGWLRTIRESRSGLPGLVRASDSYIANALRISETKARRLRLLLERGGYLQKALEERSKVGSPHYWYLPGTGKPANREDIVRGGPKRAKHEEYPRHTEAMRRYRWHHGLLHKWETDLDLEKIHEWRREVIFEAAHEEFLARVNQRQ